MRTVRGRKRDTPGRGEESMRGYMTEGYTTGGYMTVFMTLTLSVLLSLCLTLIEGARSNAVRLESYLVSNMAVDSVMAEYNRELARQYNIFAIDDSYGTPNASLDNTDRHLAMYLNKNFSGSDFFLSSLLYRDFLALGANKAETEGVLYLSDDEGNVFRQRAFEALKDDIGISMFTEILDCVRYIESNEIESIDVRGEMEKLQKQADAGQAAALSEIQSDSEGTETGKVREVRETDMNTNPTKGASAMTNPMLLYQFVEDVEKLSTSTIDLSGLYSSRKRANMVNAGNLKTEKDPGGSGSADSGITADIIERMAFHEYILRYMGRYRHEGEDDALRYQAEYIVSGTGSDMDNFVSVVGRILAIRFAIDYIYILGDEEKCEIAEALAAVIAFYTYTEPLQEVYKTLILMMWSGMEAQYDVRCILAGSRIVFLKTYESWHSTLENSLAGLEKDTTGDGSGLSYEDYLRIFMLLTDGATLNSRAMDMVEADIRLTEGNGAFRIDACIDTLAVYIDCYSEFGYGYAYHIRRKYE